LRTRRGEEEEEEEEEEEAVTRLELEELGIRHGVACMLKLHLVVALG
jgi:hypothetical protein